MSSRKRFILAVTALAAAASLGDIASAAGFERCRADLQHDVECASIDVELDRSKVVPGSLALHVERIRARSKPARGTMFVLSGGPGESVSASTDAYAGALAAARATHDLVLVDQRGTGLSGALRCPEWSGPLAGAGDEARVIEACGTALGSRLRLYTMSDVVDDLEHVRQELALDRISLFGVSYGTRVALAYASRYPERVERLVLDSVVPLVDPHAYRLNSITAVPRVLAEVCGRGCAFAPDPAAELAELVKRLETGPLTGRVARGDGRLHAARLGRADLLALLLVGDFLPSLRAQFPAAVHSALAGDAAPLLRLRDLVTRASASVEDPRSFSSTLYLATTCLESTEAWLGSATPSDRTAAARAHLAQLPDERFAPFDRATALALSDLRVCRSWPSGSDRAVRFESPLPDVPTLIFAGTVDLRTPLEDAVAVARALPRAQLVAVRAVGHAALFQGLPCVDAALERFLSGKPAGRCPRGEALPAADPVPDPTRRFAALDAALLTVDDVLGQLPVAAYTRAEWNAERFLFFMRAGGLRGGRWSATLRSLTLERVTVVPGVAVSGRLKGLVTPLEGLFVAPQGVLRVTAGGGRGGTLRFERGRVHGTLGGRRVSRTLPLVLPAG